MVKLSNEVSNVGKDTVIMANLRWVRILHTSAMPMVMPYRGSNEWYSFVQFRHQLKRAVGRRGGVVLVST